MTDNGTYRLILPCQCRYCTDEPCGDPADAEDGLCTPCREVQAVFKHEVREGYGG